MFDIFQEKSQFQISSFSHSCIEKKFCHRLDVPYTFSSNTIKLIHSLKFMININLVRKVTRDPFSPTRFSSIFLPAYAINVILSHTEILLSSQKDLLFHCLSDSLSRCQSMIVRVCLFRKSILMLSANIVIDNRCSSFLGTVFL